MLELRNISFRVGEKDSQTEIIDDISLKLEDKKTLVITGPNGGGKSTLARLIMGIEKPTSGQILLDGEGKKRNRLCFSAASQIQGTDSAQTSEPCPWQRAS